MPLKLNTKKTPFFMSSAKLCLKEDLQYNHWFVQSVIIPVDDVVFQKRK